MRRIQRNVDLSHRLCNRLGLHVGLHVGLRVGAARGRGVVRRFGRHLARGRVRGGGLGRAWLQQRPRGADGVGIARQAGKSVVGFRQNPLRAGQAQRGTRLAGQPRTCARGLDLASRHHGLLQHQRRFQQAWRKGRFLRKAGTAKDQQIAPNRHGLRQADPFLRGQGVGALVLPAPGGHVIHDAFYGGGEASLGPLHALGLFAPFRGWHHLVVVSHRFAFVACLGSGILAASCGRDGLSRKVMHRQRAKLRRSREGSPLGVTPRI